MKTHFCSYATYSGGRRTGTKFIYDVEKVEPSFHKKYFRWNRVGFKEWKKWEDAKKKEPKE